MIGSVCRIDNNRKILRKLKKDMEVFTSSSNIHVQYTCTTVYVQLITHHEPHNGYFCCYKAVARGGGGATGACAPPLLKKIPPPGPPTRALPWTHWGP